MDSFRLSTSSCRAVFCSHALVDSCTASVTWSTEPAVRRMTSELRICVMPSSPSTVFMSSPASDESWMPLSSAVNAPAASSPHAFANSSALMPERAANASSSSPPELTALLIFTNTWDSTEPPISALMPSALMDADRPSISASTARPGGPPTRSAAPSRRPPGLGGRHVVADRDDGGAVALHVALGHVHDVGEARHLGRGGLGVHVGSDVESGRDLREALQALARDAELGAQRLGVQDGLGGDGLHGGQLERGLRELLELPRGHVGRLAEVRHGGVEVDGHLRRVPAHRDHGDGDGGGQAVSDGGDARSVLLHPRAGVVELLGEVGHALGHGRGGLGVLLLHPSGAVGELGQAGRGPLDAVALEQRRDGDGYGRLTQGRPPPPCRTPPGRPR